MATATLEKKCFIHAIEKEKPEYVVCGLDGCKKTILRTEAYISPGGHPYCNEEHFRLFTED